MSDVLSFPEPAIWSEVMRFRILRLPHAEITVEGAFVFILILCFSYGCARMARSGVRRLRGRISQRGSSLLLFERLVFYAIIIAGLAVGLTTVGFNLSSLSIFAGALGVGIGLGIQGIVREFVSGVTLITDNVLKIDDFIELPSGVRGRVIEIGNRATCIRTNDRVG